MRNVGDVCPTERGAGGFGTTAGTSVCMCCAGACASLSSSPSGVWIAVVSSCMFPPTSVVESVVSVTVGVLICAESALSEDIVVVLVVIPVTLTGDLERDTEGDVLFPLGTVVAVTIPRGREVTITQIK